MGICHSEQGQVEEEGWGGGGVLSPSSLRDTTDRIALTNGHLSVGMTSNRS